MRKSGKLGLFLAVSLLVVLLGGIGWFLSVIFEGGAPRLALEGVTEYLSGKPTIKITANDKVRGLRSLVVSVRQEGREVVLLEEAFPFKGLLNRGGVHSFEKELTVDTGRLDLAEGSADFCVRVRDFSRRSGGEGNLALIEKKVVVDTAPPAIRAVSRMHNVQVGGAGLVVYETSADTAESGVYVGGLFFNGFLAGKGFPEGSHVCYFALPAQGGVPSGIYLWAKDKAGNEAKSTFYYRVRDKKFRSEDIRISDGFLERVLPYFSGFAFTKPGGTGVEKFLEVNRILREKNAATFYSLRTRTSPDQLWEGPWLRMDNAANMARFGDQRSYFYQGKKIDEQVHLGVDLASLANSEVKAANNGRVLYADSLGIYGLTVILDHGQGLESSYSHLSKISVVPGQQLRRGDVVGLTGQTGLAGGDHLHFAVFVQGVPVDPVEWWDSHWIQDNVAGKLATVRKPG